MVEDVNLVDIHCLHVEGSRGGGGDGRGNEFLNDSSNSIKGQHSSFNNSTTSNNSSPLSSKPCSVVGDPDPDDIEETYSFHSSAMEDTTSSPSTSSQRSLFTNLSSNLSLASTSNYQHHHHASSTASSEDDVEPSPTLVNFYSNRSILVTGGTGFVGKVLIEKLLYEFADITTIFILLRPKSGQSIQKRLANMIKGEAFERIRHQCPEQLDKLVPISGDVTFPGLGINPIDMHRLVDEVSVVFHSAATIRFDDPLKYALGINTTGTKRVIQLAQRLKTLTVSCAISKRFKSF